MASTGATAMADSIFAEIVDAVMVRELRPAMTSRSFVRFGAKGPSQVHSFPLWGDPGAAAALTDDLSEISSTALSDTQASATAAGVGFRVDVTDFAREITPGNLYAEVGGMAARSTAEKWETDLAALMDDFTNVTTAGGTNTPTAFLSAVSALEQRDIPAPYVGYLDPKQTGELRAELASTTAVFEIGKNDDLVRPFGDSGFFGTLYGVPIWQTSLVVTTSGQVGGGVFNSQDTIGGYIVIDQRLETQRDASFQALEFVGSMWYGLVEISDTRGQGLDSTA